MKFSLGTGAKIFLGLVFFAAAIIGFMVKLPPVFRHHDKEMHSLFYFIAAAFLNILFAKRNVIIHAVIFGVLYLFGICIEYAQDWSNKFFRKKIHGRYDPEDVQSNLKGLIAFSILWIIIVAGIWLYKKWSPKHVTERQENDIEQLAK